MLYLNFNSYINYKFKVIIYFHIYNMFKKFCYYYLFKKNKSSCRHEVGCRVAQKVQESGITNSGRPNKRF